MLANLRCIATPWLQESSARPARLAVTAPAAVLAESIASRSVAGGRTVRNATRPLLTVAGVADDHAMNHDPVFERGASLVVMLPGRRPPELRGASVLAAKGRRIALVFSTGERVEAGAEVLLIHGAVGDRLGARARCIGAKEAAFVLQVLGPWQSFDGRSDPRFQVDLEVEVRSVLGGSRQTGTVVDISLGGAAVRVASRPGGKAIELGVNAAGFASHLPCEVVGVTEGETSVVLHLRFEALAPPQRAFLRNLVARASQDFEASYRRLAS